MTVQPGRSRGPAFTLSRRISSIPAVQAARNDSGNSHVLLDNVK